MLHYRRLARYILRQRRGLAMILGCNVVMAAIGAMTPWPMKILVDQALIGHKPGPLVGPVLSWLHIAASPRALIAAGAIASLFLFVCNSLLDLSLSWGWAVVGQNMVYDLASDLFSHLQRLSPLYLARRGIGDSLSRLTGDAWCVFTVTDSLLIAPVQNLLVLVMMGLVAYHLNAQLALLTLVVAPLLGASAFAFSRGLKRRAKKDREATARLTNFVHQIFTGLPAVQAFNREERNRQQFLRLAGDSVAVSKSGVFIRNGFTLINGLATSIGVALILGVGGQHVLAHTMTVGDLLVFMAYINSMRAAVQNLLSTFANLRTADASIDRVLEVLDADEGVKEKPGAVPLVLSKGVGEVRLEKVTFGYEPGRVVLDHVDLSAKPGEVVALVGPTGAGKSTLVSLVPRFFDPWEGRVTVGGQNVRDLKLASLRGQISLVLQEPFLLPLTIRENIAYGRPGASKAEVEAAARAANADEFIARLPQGYETVLGERGATVSGGQKQRLAIARALLRNAPVLILDEPTSALDAGTEKLVLEAMEKLMAGRTVLVIAHRLSTVRRADRIVVLEQGKVTDEGSHQELVNRGGAYANLARLQLTDSKLQAPATGQSSCLSNPKSDPGAPGRNPKFPIPGALA